MITKYYVYSSIFRFGFIRLTRSWISMQIIFRSTFSSKHVTCIISFYYCFRFWADNGFCQFFMTTSIVSKFSKMDHCHKYLIHPTLVILFFFYWNFILIIINWLLFYIPILLKTRHFMCNKLLLIYVLVSKKCSNVRKITI